MSAIIHPSPAPAVAPERITREPAAPPSRGKWWIALAAIVVAGGGAYALTRGGGQPATAVTVRTAKVWVGPLERVLRITGTTAARSFASVTAPMMRGPDSGRNLVLIKLATAGASVKKGDLIAVIDAQAIKDHVDDVDALVVAADADIKQRKAEQAIEMENLRQSVRAAKAALDKARKDNQASEVRMPIDKELLQLAIDEAAAEYKELQSELGTTVEKQRAEMRVLEYTRDRHARHRDRHRRDVTRFTMRAPIGGLVVMQSVWRSGDFGQIQEGDQVWPGQPFMKIVDTRSMQVEARINQVESEDVHIGQAATVNFDAFPGLHLNGKVYSVSAMGVGGWRDNYYLRTLPVVITILGSDSRLIP
ncbi:MAG TPA: HlyD family efflux transporter periplasmic adaptor subunit, partial [Bryobacteraceae bacterium]|nr:HlyD family efflux transporter periplasmic adaptor subunit [Bryobacteraceae bacterium]